MTPKIEFFNFRLERKLEHHCSVEFHSDSDDDGFSLSKPQLELNPPNCPLGAPKNDIYNFGLEKKLDQNSSVENHGE